MGRGKHKESTDTQVLNRVLHEGKDHVFTPSDFADLGSRTAVATVLKRLKANGTIRQLGRGLYDVPRYDAKLGMLWPSLDAVVSALQDRDAVRLQPTGAHAANLLGLSDQVPMRVFYLTDGPTRSIKLGNMTVSFKQTTPRNMATAGRVSGLVIQALRWLGQSHVDSRTVKILQNRLDQSEKQQLLDDIRHAPAWIADVMRQVAQDQEV